ncbi:MULTISPECIES: TetR/AcrR family transcriptional regulator [Streptosporangium]|uniref:AcrR family transcriptional regulator n=1 Tax=Streptosporangium brasiliense TaxID=47480 RepID=A0ABT9R0C5_9ACTN|nr:TetR/AcrR family transcriptional regulator [Streptosporangium brasiliense]MDP9862668.1 AcrR family transcriptional regulator [Streptosporangium brasiliense]
MKRGPQRSVDPRAVLDAALELVDGGGLTMRALAARVGLTPGALYTYFPDRAAIMNALTDRLLAEADLGVLEDRARPPHQRIEDFALALREVLLCHPAAVPAILGAAYSGPVALRVGESMLGVLPDPRACYAVMVYVLGSIALEAAELVGAGGKDGKGAEARGALPSEAERIAARRATLAVDPDVFPRTHAAADAIAAYISTDQFRWGLRRLLAGM